MFGGFPRQQLYLMLEDPNEAGNEELATERRPNAKDRNMSEWISRKSPTGEKYAPKTEPSQTANRQQASVAQPDRLNVARLASPTAVFLSAHEFAARSGLSLSTIRRYLKNGRWLPMPRRSVFVGVAESANQDKRFHALFHYKAFLCLEIFRIGSYS